MTKEGAKDMPSMGWDTQEIGDAPVVAAPDGSEVRVLCATKRGSMISFALAPGAVSKPVAHRTVEEIWYVVGGRGRVWRKLGEKEEIAELAPGLSLTVPAGTRFQFRNDGGAVLQVVAVTMPPWPGEHEARAADGIWPVNL
jgi:mannose-6-phosphate isomerase-like protein (cupin superfamily)